MMNLHQVKLEICDIGRRIYKKGFAAANDGNISYRIAENQVLCTPTLISKGFMKPDDLCVVDMDGKQLSGRRLMTSELKLHLAIMKERPEMKSVIHCHPPHATAFGIAREPVPMCVLPEVEVFLGDVPIAKYETPASQEFANTILPFVHKSQVIILANHGTVSFGETVERAYWWTEILDAYCRMLMLARGLGSVHYLNEPEERALLNLKQKWGMPDPRMEANNCDLCGNDTFRESWKDAGVQPRAFSPPSFCNAGERAEGRGERDSAGPLSAEGPGVRAVDSAAGLANADQEALIQAVTQRVMAMLENRS